MTATRPRGRWAILEAPRVVLPLYVGVGLAAVVLVVAFPGQVPTDADWARFLALLVVSCLQTELSLGTEKARRYLADRPHINMTSVWMFSGAAVLPPAMAVALTVITYLHLWVRVWWPIQGRHAYRVVFSAATVLLAVMSVQPVLRLFGAGDVLRADWQGGLVLLAFSVSILVYTSVNGVPVAIAVKAHHPARPWSKTFGTKAENALELATLSLGAVTATVLVTQPVLVALMLLPVIVLHRNVLMRQLEEKAAQDSKTGMLTAEEWQTRVAAELVRNARTREPFAVLMVDLDRFKKVNDTYGHVAGDAVLRTVAMTITGQLRAYDSVGRWGGEEFVVLLPQIPGNDARDVAERIRVAVGALTVTVTVSESTHVITDLSASVGVACFPDAATTVDGLVHVADERMYQAKRAGRNTVVTE